jgi:hypothetical protein
MTYGLFAKNEEGELSSEYMNMGVVAGGTLNVNSPEPRPSSTVWMSRAHKDLATHYIDIPDTANVLPTITLPSMLGGSWKGGSILGAEPYGSGYRVYILAVGYSPAVHFARHMSELPLADWGLTLYNEQGNRIYTSSAKVLDAHLYSNIAQAPLMVAHDGDSFSMSAGYMNNAPAFLSGSFPGRIEAMILDYWWGTAKVNVLYGVRAYVSQGTTIASFPVFVRLVWEYQSEQWIPTFREHYVPGQYFTYVKGTMYWNAPASNTSLFLLKS